MAITIVPSVVTGQTYSAANYNTQVRDNINGIWVLTTAGDMLYATGASAAARLALVTGGVMYGGASAPAWLSPGSQNQNLRMGATYPEWAGYIAGKVRRITNQSINSGVATNVQFTSVLISQGGITWDSGDNTKLTVGVTGGYYFGAVWSMDGGGGRRDANILSNGSVILEDRSDDPAETVYASFGDFARITAGAYLQLSITHAYGSALNLRKAYLYAFFIGP